jgi:hypothetical protein
MADSPVYVVLISRIPNLARKEFRHRKNLDNSSDMANDFTSHLEIEDETGIGNSFGKGPAVRLRSFPR